MKQKLISMNVMGDDSNAELEQRIADLEAKNTILEENMKIILDAMKLGKINPSGNPPDPSVV